MAAEKKIKVTSKNSSIQYQKAKQKFYKDKLVKPVRYIDRDLRISYMSAEYVDGSLVKDESGNPIKWSNV